MSIQIEFCPDLALREFSKIKEDGRKPEECIPEKIEEGNEYEFLKNGQRGYWLNGELPLLITAGNQQLSKPIASIKIIETRHFKINNEIWTSGKYKVIKKISDEEIYFNGCEPIK